MNLTTSPEDNSKPQYIVNTSLLTEGVIKQVASVHKGADIKVIYAKLVMTLERQLREKLIQLGWTPPESDFESIPDSPQRVEHMECKLEAMEEELDEMFEEFNNSMLCYGWNCGYKLGELQAKVICLIGEHL